MTVIISADSLRDYLNNEFGPNAGTFDASLLGPIMADRTTDFEATARNLRARFLRPGEGAIIAADNHIAFVSNIAGDLYADRVLPSALFGDVHILRSCDTPRPPPTPFNPPIDPSIPGFDPNDIPVFNLNNFRFQLP